MGTEGGGVAVSIQRLAPQAGGLGPHDDESDLAELTTPAPFLLALAGVPCPVEKGFLGCRGPFNGALSRRLGDFLGCIGPADQNLVLVVLVQILGLDLDFEFKTQDRGDFGDRDVMPRQLPEAFQRLVRELGRRVEIGEARSLGGFGFLSNTARPLGTHRTSING